MGYKDYGFPDAGPSHMHRHFVPPLIELCAAAQGTTRRVLDVGCGNGATAGKLLASGYEVVGIDLSVSGIEVARRAHPEGRFEVLPADEHILEALACEPFDIVISTEVIEHLYAPRDYIAGCYHALRAQGRFICSTPYHGYLKNLALGICNHWDRHHPKGSL